VVLNLLKEGKAREKSWAERHGFDTKMPCIKRLTSATLHGAMPFLSSYEEAQKSKGDTQG
jgi:hypothetical protein